MSTENSNVELNDSHSDRAKRLAPEGNNFFSIVDGKARISDQNMENLLTYFHNSEEPEYSQKALVPLLALAEQVNTSSGKLQTIVDNLLYQYPKIIHTDALRDKRTRLETVIGEFNAIRNIIKKHNSELLNDTFNKVKSRENNATGEHIIGGVEARNALATLISLKEVLKYIDEVAQPALDGATAESLKSEDLTRMMKEHTEYCERRKKIANTPDAKGWRW